MFSSADRGSAQHVPAWKRLGLKLKQPAAPESANGVGQPSSNAQQHYSQSSSGGKRRLDTPPAGASPKKPRRDDVAADRNARLRQGPKSVSFGDTPTKNGNKPPVGEATQKPAKQQKKKAKAPAKQAGQPAADLTPALGYLRQWRDARDGWKFNKNHQSALIKHAFDPEPRGIPSADVDAFYEYIRDLKGFVRTRLRETAMEIRTKDAADGASAFPEGTTDLDVTQSTYETLLRELLPSRQPGSKRKAFHEAEYVASAEQSQVIIQRIIKRMRAELVLDELSDSGETDVSTTSSSSGTLVASESQPADGEKRVKLNDGSGKRRRKLRVSNLDGDTSSSESESDSDSDSDTSSSGSSSSSSSSGSDDEEEDRQVEGYESSSSSSSESESESSADETDSDAGSEQG